MYGVYGKWYGRWDLIKKFDTQEEAYQYKRSIDSYSNPVPLRVFKIVDGKAVRF